MPPARPPTLLLVVTEDWTLVSHRLPILRAARAAGWRVVAAARVRDHAGPILETGAELRPLEIAREGRNPVHELATIAAMRSLYASIRPTVVHHVGMKPVLYGGWAARLAGVRGVVQAFAGMGSLYTDPAHGDRTRRVAEALLRPVTRREGTRILVQNDADASLVIARGLARPEQVRLIRGSGVDLERFAPSPEPTGVPVVVLPARLLGDKGVREFVAAAAMLRGRARFVLVGDADAGNPSAIPGGELAQWVADGVVEWWRHRDDMPNVYAEANLVVLPSYREGMPKALLEAAACGRATVATRVPGCDAVVTDGESGTLIPARTVAPLAEAMRALLDDPSRRVRYGAAARRRAEADFSDVAVAAQTLAIYTEFLS